MPRNNSRLSLLRKFKQTADRYGLIEKKDRIVIGVSGGPDSVALCILLNALKKELGFTLYIAHLDHMLRGASFSDKEFVEKLAKRLSIPLTFARINVASLHKQGSLEEFARKVRFDFLFKTARRLKVKKIALGHNLDDQAETVLMRIIRGTGLQGLSAILPKRKINNFTIIRPLIEINRREIESFLRRKKIKPCRDETNSQEIYFRNKIRMKLLPFLENRYNKNIKESLSNLAETSAYDYDYLRKESENKFPKRGRRLSLARLRGFHPAMRRLILRLGIANIQGDTRRITFKHIRELEDLIFGRPINSVVDLPKGVSVSRGKNCLSFYRRKI